MMDDGMLVGWSSVWVVVGRAFVRIEFGVQWSEITGSTSPIGRPVSLPTVGFSGTSQAS